MDERLYLPLCLFDAGEQVRSILTSHACSLRLMFKCKRVLRQKLAMNLIPLEYGGVTQISRHPQRPFHAIFLQFTRHGQYRNHQSVCLLNTDASIAIGHQQYTRTQFGLHLQSERDGKERHSQVAVYLLKWACYHSPVRYISTRCQVYHKI